MKIISEQVELQPKECETEVERQAMERYKNMLSGTLETYAAKVQSEQEPSRVLAASLQIIGAAMLILAGRQRRRVPAPGRTAPPEVGTPGVQ